MHTHQKDPGALSALLPRFVGGEFILIKGRGKDAFVFNGTSNRLLVPEPTRNSIVIYPTMVSERWTGCNADFTDRRMWKPVENAPETFAIDYTWYYLQKKHERLKLQSLAHDERCWLCSSRDPIYLQQFRERLLRMAIEESTRRETVFRRLRNRIFRNR